VGEVVMKEERGNAIVEMVLVLPILVLLLFGGFELSRGIAAHHALDTGVSTAARGLSIDPAQYDWAETTIRNSVSGNVLCAGLGSSVTIHIYDQYGATLTPEQLDMLGFGAPFWIEATLPFTAVVPFVNLPGRTIAVAHTEVVERWP
jgi:Flp pilus assembly protein TadG